VLGLAHPKISDLGTVLRKYFEICNNDNCFSWKCYKFPELL
jgi:hypothetical protein